VTGAQFSGVAGVAGTLTGFQSSGTLSIAQDLSGVQSSGFLNVARSVDGVQAGVVNVAAAIRGVQLGVFNYAQDAEGVPLGVVSWVQNGIHEISAGYDTAANGAFVRWTGGSRMFWTSLELGFQTRPTSDGGSTIRRWWADAGLGLRWQAERLGFDLGAGVRQLNVLDTERTDLNMVPHLDAALRFALTNRLALWAGPRFDWVDSRLVSVDQYRGGAIRLFDFSPGTDALYLGFSAGLAFQL
jgi:hypothetical protein